MIRDEFQVEHWAVAKRRRWRKAKEPDIYVTQIHLQVWRTALALAGGDPRRLEIISETEVVVRNDRS
jgi:hypothetical protein